MRCRLKTTLLQNKLRWSKIMCYIGGFSLILWFCFNILAVTVFRNQLYKTSHREIERWVSVLNTQQYLSQASSLWISLSRAIDQKTKNYTRKKQNKTKKNTVPLLCKGWNFLPFVLSLSKCKVRALSEKYFLESPHIVLTFAERKVYARLFFS